MGSQRGERLAKCGRHQEAPRENSWGRRRLEDPSISIAQLRCDLISSAMMRLAFGVVIALLALSAAHDEGPVREWARHATTHLDRVEMMKTVCLLRILV